MLKTHHQLALRFKLPRLTHLFPHTVSWSGADNLKSRVTLCAKRLNIHKSCVLPTEFIHAFCMVLTTNSD